MPNENQDLPNEGDTQNVDVTVSELQKSFEEKLNAMKEEYDKKLSGRDRSYNELRKELEDKDQQIKAKEQEGLTEVEKLSLQLQQEKDARVKFENDLKLERYKSIANKELENAGLSKDYIDFVKLDSEDSIKESVEKLSNIWGMEKQNLATNFAKNNGGSNPTPTGTTPSKGWKDMSMGERTALWKSNPEQAQQLMDEATPRR